MGFKKRCKTRTSSYSKKTFREEINTYNPKKSEKRGKEGNKIFAFLQNLWVIITAFVPGINTGVILDG